MQPIRPWHILAKALILFMLANFLFAVINPPVEKITLYNTLLPGRLRFPFGDGIAHYDLTIDELEALFASHILSGTPKTKDEFRVLVLGDSAVWGEQLSEQETLAAQLNGLGLTCQNQSVRFYNLGYPHPFALKDLIILQKGMEYQPDAVMWMLTLNTIRKKQVNPFLTNNYQQSLSVLAETDLDFDISLLQKPEPTLWDRSIVGQRNRLSRLFSAQWFGFYWAAGVEPEHNLEAIAPIKNDLDDDLRYAELEPDQSINAILWKEALHAAIFLAKQTPLIFVNEPMFIATGENSDVRYNKFYPKWAFDEYRQIIAAEAIINNWAYLDLWNSIPNQYFSDTPLHLTAEGEKMLAEQIAPYFLSEVCNP